MASAIIALTYLSYQGIQTYRRKRKEQKLKESIMSPSEEKAKQKDKETLREKAARKLHGGKKGDQNPSQLGDPTSLKAETSEKVPVDGEKGARSSEDTLVGRSEDSGEKIREKKVKETHGGEKGDNKNNPSLLGDPISTEKERETDAKGRESKL